MKKLFTTITIALLAVTYLQAQDVIQDTVGLGITTKEGVIVYEEVIEMPGKTKNDLYLNAKSWFTNSFKDAKYVIQDDNKEDGRIMGKGRSRVYIKSFIMTVDEPADYSVQIDCKDGKYRYRIYDIQLSLTNVGKYEATLFFNKLIGIKPSAPHSKSQSKSYLAAIGVQVKALSNSIKKSMASKPDTF